MGGSPERVERVEELLARIVAALDLDATVEVVDEGHTITGTVHGESLGLFIGHHGQTIDAVQHLATRIVLRDAGDDRPVVVIDADGYRERRREALVGQADAAADEALRSDGPAALAAMSAGERKIVHEHLRDRDDIETYSEGEEPDRHLVVAPARD